MIDRRTPIRRIAHAGILLPLLLALLSGGCGEAVARAPAPPQRAPLDPPLVASVVPGQGLPDDRIAISGAGFSSHPLVFFGDAEARVIDARETSLVVEVPRGAAPGIVALTVSTTGGSSAEIPFALGEPFPGGPRIERIVPEVAARGKDVVVEGEGFSPDPAANSLTLGGAPVTVRDASPERLVFEVPAGATSGKVAVAVGGLLSNGRTLFVTSRARPRSPGMLGDENLSYIRAAPYAYLVIEVDAEAGCEPTDAALAAFVATLGARIRKPGGIVVVRDAPFTSDEAVWDDGELGDQWASARNRYALADTAVAHVIFVDGHYASNPDSLGRAAMATGFTIFEEEARAAAESAGVPVALAETWVLIHEAGHLLGLVDLGTPAARRHDDPASMGHDVTPDCVMYRTTLALEWSLTPAYCELCIEDLRAVGGR